MRSDGGDNGQNQTCTSHRSREVCRRRRLDRDWSHLNTIRAIDVEGAVGEDDRSRELPVSTSDCQIAFRLTHGQTGAIAGPSASREWPCAWAGGTAAAGEQAAARDEGGDEHKCRPRSHSLVITPRATRIKPSRIALCSPAYVPKRSPWTRLRPRHKQQQRKRSKRISVETNVGRS